MTERPSTWRDVTRDAFAWVEDALTTGSLDPADPDRWIHETADGCGHVIYYGNTFSLYMDPAAPAAELDPEPSTDPLALLQSYAFDVVEQALRSAVEALAGPDAPAWGPCLYCAEPVERQSDGLVVCVRSGDDGGTFDWCTVAEDHKHRRVGVTMPRTA